MIPGHLSTLRELLKLPGINVNAADIDGSTPLHRAAEKADDMYYICSKQHSPSHGCSKWYHLTINHKVTFYNIFVKGKLKWWRCWVLMKLVIMSYQLWRSPWSRCKLRCLPWRNPWGTCIWDRGEPGSKKFPFFTSEEWYFHVIGASRARHTLCWIMFVYNVMYA